MVTDEVMVTDTNKNKIRKFFKGLAGPGRLNWDWSQWYSEAECEVFARVRRGNYHIIELEAQFLLEGIKVFAYLYPPSLISEPQPIKIFGNIVASWEDYNADPQHCGKKLNVLLAEQIQKFAEEMVLVAKEFSA